MTNGCREEEEEEERFIEIDSGDGECGWVKDRGNK